MSLLLTLGQNVPAPVRLRRVGPVPNCPDNELAGPSWPCQIGIAELVAPSCPRPLLYADYLAVIAETED